MHLFYFPELQADFITLNEEESKHCVKVLRMKPGDTVILADGKGTEAHGIIADANPRKCEVQITERVSHTPYRKYSLHIYLAPTKNADRMEWFVEKAVECGVDAITFIETRNAERTRVNMDRMHKIAVSAMKQSKQWFLPQLNDLIKWDKLGARSFDCSGKYLAFVNVSAQQQLPKLMAHDYVSGKKSFCVAIGPEGDFDVQEVKAAEEAGFIAVTLGNSVLRTETAALFACMCARSVCV